ncbi:MAG: hypothetical protein K9W44_11170 [Candidatus Lokiarchaeota archaeon]|nr:hypothetical protein [Candidatus Harpocratesius repetitus]
MTQKTISLSEKAYKELKKAKKKGESFSKTILRILGISDNADIMSLAGTFTENSDEWEQIEQILYKNRIDDNDLDIEEIEE